MSRVHPHTPKPEPEPEPLHQPVEPDHAPLPAGDTPTPWVAATELQPGEGKREQKPKDLVDEISMESFPASDAPSHGNRRKSDKDEAAAQSPPAAPERADNPSRS